MANIETISSFQWVFMLSVSTVVAVVTVGFAVALGKRLRGRCRVPRWHPESAERIAAHDGDLG